LFLRYYCSGGGNEIILSMSVEFQQRHQKTDTRIEIRGPERERPQRIIRKPEVEKKHIKRTGKKDR